MLIRQYVFNVRLFLSLVILPRDLRDKVVRLLVDDLDRELHKLRERARTMS